MAINRSLSCRWRWKCIAMLLLLVIPLSFVHGSRLSAEERQPRRTTEDNDNATLPACSCKTNNYTVGSDGSVPVPSAAAARSEVDNSDRLVPTGPNPLHHRHH